MGVDGAIVGVARRCFNGDPPLAQYGRTMAYGWYVVHQPVIVAVAFVVVLPGAGRALIHVPGRPREPTLSLAAGA